MGIFCDTIEFHVINCWSCTAPFAINSRLYRERQKDRKEFWCPSCGTGAVFSGETAEQRELRETKTALERSERCLQQAETSAKEVRKQYVKIRNRIRKGMCPCCNEVFPNLAQHMQAKHVDYGSNDLVRALREAFGLTQANLAKEIGTSAPYISNYELGKSVPGRVKRWIESWLSRQVMA